MKLNNKGFAITAVLYGLLILFVILVSSYLLVLSIKKDRVDTIVNEIESDYTGSTRTLGSLINDLYTNAAKTVVSNNGLDYNYAPSVNLMNDRLGDANVPSNSGNIRYYGANPNNYIYFNCSDYNNQSSSTCEKWRIIGIVDGKVKIIREESIGSLAWDAAANDYNKWNTSTINAYLNQDYYNNLNKKNSKTLELISESTYYLGGYNTTTVYSDQIYNYERTNRVGTTIYSGNPFTVNSNIGLMYASDYGYATNFDKCNSSLVSYDDEECYRNNWIPHYAEEWLITPNSASSSDAWFVQPSGYVSPGVYGNTSSKSNVRPVLYLNTDVMVNKGNGSSDDPYQIYYR